MSRWTWFFLRESLPVFVEPIGPAESASSGFSSSWSPVGCGLSERPKPVRTWYVSWWTASTRPAYILAPASSEELAICRTTRGEYNMIKLKWSLEETAKLNQLGLFGMKCFNPIEDELVEPQSGYEIVSILDGHCNTYTRHNSGDATNKLKLDFLSFNQEQLTTTRPLSWQPSNTHMHD